MNTVAERYAAFRASMPPPPLGVEDYKAHGYGLNRNAEKSLGHKASVKKGLAPSHRNACRDPRREKPGHTTYRDLGRQLSRQMEPQCTISEIGRAVGLSQQNTSNLIFQALGKVGWHLFQALRERNRAA